MAHEEETSTNQIPEPSPVPIPDDSMPSAPTSELEQPISQDSPVVHVASLNNDWFNSNNLNNRNHGKFFFLFSLFSR